MLSVKLYDVASDLAPLYQALDAAVASATEAVIMTLTPGPDKTNHSEETAAFQTLPIKITPLRDLPGSLHSSVPDDFYGQWMRLEKYSWLARL